MNYQEMINNKFESIREQIQEDLLTLLDYDNVKEEIKNEACKVVVDRFAELMPLLKSDQFRVFCNNSLTDSESKLLRIRHHKRQTEVLDQDNSKFSKKKINKSE